MYDVILVPTDGSDGSNEALRHGIDLARKYDATVHLVYIVDEGIYGHYGGIDAIEHAEEALEEAGREALFAARERVEASSLPVEEHLERATPHEGILDTARQVGADLIVMGTERRSGEYRRLLGSVSERVIRTSSIPVHLVKTEPEGESDAEVRPATASDIDGIRTVARHSMVTDYTPLLAETEIDEAVERWYGTEAFEELLSGPKSVVLVALKDDALVGFSQSHVIDAPTGTIGEIHWIHVDPEHRGEGIGTLLFDRTQSALDDRGVDRIDTLVLADYEPGNAFYRARGLERIDSRPVRIGEASLEENVYATAQSADERLEPRIESHTTADGETLYVDYEESEIGSKAPFFAAYTTRDLDVRYGWYCSNCASFDTAMDTMGRIVCNQCGNRHKATRWDAVVTE